MNKDEKITFINDLTDCCKQEIINKILNNKIPENWDGIELRQYISEKFKEVVWLKILTGKRKREYKNTKLINNL